MAIRPQRICRAVACKELHRNANGYCEQHQEQAAAWNTSRKGSAADRGYGAAWRRLRVQVLRRDGWRCRCNDCVSTGRVREASEVDHIIPKFEGGTDEPSNLQAINPECHKKKTQAESIRAARRFKAV